MLTETFDHPYPSTVLQHKDWHGHEDHSLQLSAVEDTAEKEVTFINADLKHHLPNLHNCIMAD